MSTVDKDGMLVDARVQLKRFPQIEKGSLDALRAIVVHQTDSASEDAAFGAYLSGGNGAHFLIARDGRIFQTASMSKRCYHVGRLIKSRCLEVLKSSCKDAEIAKATALGWTSRINMIDRIERAKSYPDRYPVNSDSIGIELVGKHVDDKTYQDVTPEQNLSLQWLIDQIYKHYSLDKSDVFRHPEVSYKNPGEAAGASWR